MDESICSAPFVGTCNDSLTLEIAEAIRRKYECQEQLADLDNKAWETEQNMREFQIFYDLLPESDPNKDLNLTYYYAAEKLLADINELRHTLCEDILFLQAQIEKWRN